MRLLPIPIRRCHDKVLLGAGMLLNLPDVAATIRLTGLALAVLSACYAASPCRSRKR